MFVNVSGVFRKGIPWVNVGGSWKKGIASWVNVAGVWRKMSIGIVRTFTDISDAVALRDYNTQINAIGSDTTGTKILIVGDVGTFSYSSDGGSTWTSGQQPGDNFESCLWNPKDSKFYVGDHKGNIFSSTNPNSGFTLVEKFGNAPIVGIEYVKDSNGVEKLLVLSLDGNMKDLLNPSATFTRGLNSGITTNASCLASQGDLVFAGFQFGYASLSTDGGATFTKLPRGLGIYSRPHLTDVAIHGDTILVGMADQYASISTDRGQTWKPLPRGFGNPSRSQVLGTSVVAREDELVALMYNGQAFSSVTNGSTWEPLERGLGSLNPNIYHAVIQECGPTLYAGFNNGYVSKGVSNG